MTRWFVRTVWINSAIIRNILSTPLSGSQLEEDAVSELSILPGSVARVQKRHLHRLSTLVPSVLFQTLALLPWAGPPCRVQALAQLSGVPTHCFLVFNHHSSSSGRSVVG